MLIDSSPRYYNILLEIDQAFPDALQVWLKRNPLDVVASFKERLGVGPGELMGYPVGEAKLTPEMQSLFPEWRGEGDEVTVHNVLKHIVNLRALAPDKLIERAVFPERIVICLAERNGGTHTAPGRLSAEAAMERMLPDTIFRDEVPAMARSLESAGGHVTLGAPVRRILVRHVLPNVFVQRGSADTPGDLARVRSLLDDIPGVGAAKKKALLRHFGDIDSLRKAGPEELRKVPGITDKLAEEILRHLNPVNPA